MENSIDDTKNLPVVLLCGGKGTRMWPLTSQIPKPLILIGDKPILWHLMNKYSSYGHKNFILCLGHMKEKIIEYFAKSENRNPHWDITFIDTGLDTSKSQRIMQVKNHIKTKHFLLSYGDDLSGINITNLIDFHQNKNAFVTLTSVPLYSQFGVLEIDETNQVKSFTEKPKLKDYWINGGFFVCNSNIFDYLHLGEFEDEVLRTLAIQGRVCAFKFDGFWKCMNTSKDAIEFNKLYEGGKNPWMAKE